jgi:hypothetical protein
MRIVRFVVCCEERIHDPSPAVSIRTPHQVQLMAPQSHASIHNRIKNCGQMLRALPIAVILSAGCGGSNAATEIVGPSPRCQIAVNGPAEAVSAGGGRVNANVSVARDCTWAATSEASWIQVSPRSGQGGAAIAIVVAANDQEQSRSATIVINDQLLTVSQQPMVRQEEPEDTKANEPGVEADPSSDGDDNDPPPTPPTVVPTPPTVVPTPPTVVPAPPTVVPTPPTVVPAPPTVVPTPPTAVPTPPTAVPPAPPASPVPVSPTVPVPPAVPPSSAGGGGSGTPMPGGDDEGEGKDKDKKDRDKDDRDKDDRDDDDRDDDDDDDDLIGNGALDSDRDQDGE